MTTRKTKKESNFTAPEALEALEAPEAPGQENFLVSIAEIAEPQVETEEEEEEELVEELIEELVEEPIEELVKVPKTSSIFLGEEDRRLLKKFNSHIIKKLGLTSTRSFKV